MIPVSGSAYTYSYATLGEIIAWIIGWDLILEYAVGNMAVAVGWSGYFVQLCGSLFDLKFPLWLVSDYRTASSILSTGGEALNNYSSTTLPVIAGHPIALNLPAVLIVAAVTSLLIYGIRESARTNTTIVIIKVAVVVFVIAFGAFMVHPTNWHPFLPNGFGGSDERRGHRLFRLHRIRRRFDDGGGNKKSAARHADRNHCEPDHLHVALRADGGRHDRNEKIHDVFRRFGGGRDGVRR